MQDLNFHRSGTGEAWVSGATGVGALRLASYGTDVAEGGAQAARASASFAAVVSGSGATPGGQQPTVPARGDADARLEENSGTRTEVGWSVGIAAFVRQPLSAPCMDVGTGCDRPATTVGIALQASMDVRRSGPATPDAAAPPAAAGPAP